MLTAAGTSATFSIRASVLLLFFAACSSDTHHVTVSTGDGSSCQVPASCDILQAACQRAVLALTACVRHDSVPQPPPFRVITQDQYRKELQALVKKLGIKSTPWDGALQRLGLIAKGMSATDAQIEEQVSEVAAFYNDSSKDITLIEEQVQSDPLSQMYVLSHELTHYLQDRSLDLAALTKKYAGSSDNAVSVVSLIEGEAVVNSTRALALLHSSSPDAFRWDAFFDALLTQVLTAIPKSSSTLYTAQNNLPYAVGSRYVADVWNAYDRDHVEMLFDGPALHLTDWISGYGSGELAPSLIEPLDCAPPLAPSGFVVYGVDSLGVSGALALLLSADDTTSANDSFDLASTLTNDAIAVYAKSTGKDAPLSPVLVAWRLRFSSIENLTTFTARVRPALGANAQLVTAGTELLITTSDQQDNPLTGPKLDECPALKDLTPSGMPSRSSMMSGFRRSRRTLAPL